MRALPSTAVSSVNRPRRLLLHLGLKSLCILTMLAALLMSCHSPISTEATVHPLAGWRLLWSDEFNGSLGPPDATKWRAVSGGDGWGNQELQYYTNRPQNVSLDGQGHLVITSRAEKPDVYRCWYGTCKYSSARLTTENTFSQQYGYFEARIKIPRGQGVWPAFWMLGNNVDAAGWPASGEVDVMEALGNDPSVVYGSLHGPDDDGLTGTFSSPGRKPLSDGFHNFAVQWSPSSFVWYVDGQAYETRTRSDVGPSGWVFDRPFFMLLNVAVGGHWPGGPDASTEFPQQMLVDYVRVYDTA
jgi:beta-glucanase (GH16 family)